MLPYIIMDLPISLFFFYFPQKGFHMKQFFEWMGTVTASSSNSSCVVMSVSILVRLSFSVLYSKSSFVLSNR